MKVLVATGASGGHIFPALSFLNRLKEKHKDTDILLVLPKKNIKIKTDGLGYRVNYISISSFGLGLDFKNFLSLWNFFKGTLESIFILISFKPDIVIGFGSLVCVPLVIFAWAFRIETLIHEQNVIPGRANKLLAKIVGRIAISFLDSEEYFKDYKKKVIFTGNPLRQEISRIDKYQALDFFGLSHDKFTILVMGGSQGSHRINLAFLKAVSKISDKSGFQVIHLAGFKDLAFLEEEYRNLGISVRLFGFLEPIAYAYSACDLILSRAGATSISEIIFFKLPAIIIPYPYAYKHQMMNARALEKNGSALIIEDSQFYTDKLLKEILESLMNNPDKLQSMGLGYRNQFALSANDLLAEAVISLTGY